MILFNHSIRQNIHTPLRPKPIRHKPIKSINSAP